MSYHAEYFVGDERSRTVAVTPETRSSATRDPYEPGDPWEIRFTDDDGRAVRVELTPRALQELYIEVKDIGVDARQAGHRAECDLCGEMVDLEKAIPDKREEPVHRHCYVDAYGGPVWLE